MGYTTTFTGRINVEPALSANEIEYLIKFAETRRMDREKGPYWVGGTGMMGQGRDPDVRDYNRPPRGQPGLWCQWIPTKDGTGIEWNEVEKFYDSAEWMAYLIEHFIGDDPKAVKYGGLTFLRPHTLNGEILAQGEDVKDRWKLIVTNNVVTRRDIPVPDDSLVKCPHCGSEFELQASV